MPWFSTLRQAVLKAFCCALILAVREGNELASFLLNELPETQCLSWCNTPLTKWKENFLCMPWITDLPFYAVLNLCVSISTSWNLSLLGRKSLFSIKTSSKSSVTSGKSSLLFRKVLLMQPCTWDFPLDGDSLSVFNHSSLFVPQIIIWGTCYKALFLRF